MLQNVGFVAALLAYIINQLAIKKEAKIQLTCLEKRAA